MPSRAFFIPAIVTCTGIEIAGALFTLGKSFYIYT